ncbi:MAG: cupin domain-containing protein [Myxococcota bacterium]
MKNPLVAALQLLPHPEGGYFRETYRAPTLVEIDGERRSASTAILFMLEASSFSSLHRIRSDEVWHFYRGSDLEVVSIDEEGLLRVERLGGDPSTGSVPQVVVPRGRWFGARLVSTTNPEAYSLVGCTVAPGFEFRDLELANRDELLAEYPTLRDEIVALTRP